MVLEWHRLARQPVTPTATEQKLLSLPPYASGLNPVEYVWDELREKHFYNPVFDSLDALLEIDEAHGGGIFVSTKSGRIRFEFWMMQV
jgi:transposase